MAKKKWVFDPGTFNKAPTGWREVTVQYFSHRDLLSPNRWEKRQIRELPDGTSIEPKYISCLLFWESEESGWAIQPDWKGNTMRYYLFGCQHKWKVLTSNNSVKTFKCKTCGKITHIDSSD